MVETLTIKEAILLLFRGLSITYIIDSLKSAVSKTYQGYLSLYFAIFFILTTGLFILIFPYSFSIINNTWEKRIAFIIIDLIIFLILMLTFLLIHFKESK